MASVKSCTYNDNLVMYLNSKSSPIATNVSGFVIVVDQSNTSNVLRFRVSEFTGLFLPGYFNGMSGVSGVVSKTST